MNHCPECGSLEGHSRDCPLGEPTGPEPFTATLPDGETVLTQAGAAFVAWALDTYRVSEILGIAGNRAVTVPERRRAG